MPRTPEQNREYMRAYRASKKLEAAMILVTEKPGLTLVPDGYIDDVVRMQTELDALREEVARLKQELATRVTNVGPSFNSRPFTPVPKKATRS